MLVPNGSYGALVLGRDRMICPAVENQRWHRVRADQVTMARMELQAGSTSVTISARVVSRTLAVTGTGLGAAELAVALIAMGAALLSIGRHPNRWQRNYG